MTVRLVIANRGEIARRILRAARERGAKVAVLSTPEDRDAPVRREADAVLEVPSFLAADAIIEASRGWGAHQLHPGYGSLSENADFAQAVEAAGIAFVGPTPENMRAMGGKESAKALARRAGVPTLDALFSSELADLAPGAWEGALAQRGIAAPFLVKASGGGGGRGMRVVGTAADLPEAIRRASDEALASFKDGTVFVERYLSAPRHIEIQVFGDGRGGGVFLGERECSLQRRHQKVLEEAPSSVVGPALREAMGRAALALVRETCYRGAGTVEFLLDEAGGFHFLEMNTRLQVEHPVTELVYGVDLVHAQLDLAEGRWPASLGDPGAFAVPVPRGVCFEARVLAEDPRHDFLPTPGPLTVYREPGGPGIRVDSGVVEGGRVNDRFDSMIAKLIVWGEDRARAAARLSEALQAFVILGCTTNLPFLQAVSRHPDFRAGVESTAWIGEHLAALNGPLLPEGQEAFLRSRDFLQAVSEGLKGLGVPQAGPAARFAAQGGVELRIGGQARREFHLEPRGPHRFAIFQESREGEQEVWACRQGPGRLALAHQGEVLLVEDPLDQLPVPTGPAGAGTVCAPMAGLVLEVRVGEGDTVQEGQVLFILESMKMQMEVRAPLSGRVATLHATAGQVLPGPDPMAEIEAVTPG